MGCMHGEVSSCKKNASADTQADTHTLSHTHTHSLSLCVSLSPSFSLSDLEGVVAQHCSACDNAEVAELWDMTECTCDHTVTSATKCEKRSKGQKHNQRALSQLDKPLAQLHMERQGEGGGG